MKAYVHSYESLAGVDGDGLRYAVFLSGCPLSCVYCHNPDTWICGKGTEISVPDLVEKVTRYKPYFKNGGGVTFSGGEPLLQADFIAECRKGLWQNGISYIIDTSGAVKLTDAVKLALSGAESVLLDIKFPSDGEYISYTCHSFSNTSKILEYLEEIQKRVTVRTVIIPGINDSEEKMREYATIASRFILEKCLKKVLLLRKNLEQKMFLILV